MVPTYPAASKAAQRSQQIKAKARVPAMVRLYRRAGFLSTPSALQTEPAPDFGVKLDKCADQEPPWPKKNPHQKDLISPKA
jgi:hypothetical protein